MRWWYLCGLVLAGAAWAGDAAEPMGEPVAELPLWRCVGVYWLVAGDDNANARVDLAWRSGDGDAWRAAMPLLRVERGVKPEAGPPRPEVPAGAWLFAGSLIDVKPGSAYELRLTLSDPDGQSVERIVSASTIDEPVLPPNLPTRHVVPGHGGGSGSEDDPYRGLAAAQPHARPGCAMLLHAGTYSGPWEINAHGEPGRPIAWRSAGDGEVVIDGGGGQRAVVAYAAHDLWFEGLTLRGATWALAANEASRVVVKRCRFEQCQFAMVAQTNRTDGVRGWFIADNEMVGPCTWPRTRGIEDPRAIQITGTQMTVVHNRIRGWADGIDTFGSQRCENIEIAFNDISECTDDGIELDYSTRNVRCFGNRLVNCFDGISFQPIFGGPVYALRNVLYNQGMGPYKLHNSPSGALIWHNTSVRSGQCLEMGANVPVRNSSTRNNLLLGTRATYAFECLPRMVDCDFDYDGFGGGPFDRLFKWNDVRYPTVGDIRARAPAERHWVALEPDPFASGLRAPDDLARQYEGAGLDFRLRPTSAAVDAGQVLPGINDGYEGKAPDLGALELGAAPPRYGVRSTPATPPAPGPDRR